MLLPKLLLFSLTLSKFVIHLDAKRCPKGHRLKDGSCHACPDGYFQPEENDSPTCIPCTKCSQKLGSSVKKLCTTESNTECQCRKGFVTAEADSASCICGVGFEQNDKKDCVKCRDGYFNNKNNSECIKWKQCKSGVKSPGSTTSDVVCNNLNETIHTASQTLRPREASQTLSTRTTTTITTASPQHKSTTKDKEALAPSSSTGNYIGVALLTFGIVGLLILTAVTCKLHLCPCLQRQMPGSKNDSCRRPVEECGDDSLSSLKLNAEEP